MYSNILSPKLRSGWPLALGIVLAVVSTFSSCVQAENDSLSTNEQNHTHSIALGWIPYWDQEAAMASFKANSDLFSHISLFWYFLDNRGRVKKYKHAREDEAILKYAQNKGVKVLAIVTNLPDDDDASASNWDPDRVWQVIESEQSREKHVRELMDLVNRMGFDGINIDYEFLPGKYRQEFTEFIRLLGSRLHEEGKILAVALHAKTSEGNPKEDNGSHAQDWEAIHPYVDQMHFMTYGEHTAGSAPGPIASPGWVEKVLRYALEDRKVPAEKIFLGLPLYAEVWRKVGENEYKGLSEDFTFEKIESLVEKFNAEVQWDGASSSPYFSFTDKSGNRVVSWFENGESIRTKLSLREQFGLRNIALWRLGGEDKQVWEEIRNALH